MLGLSARMPAIASNVAPLAINSDAWTARGKLTGEAEKVITVRRATVVPIKDADTFFTELAEKIRALEDMEVADPISAGVAVARGIWPTRSSGSTSTTSDRFSPHDDDVTQATVHRRLRAYEADLNTLMAVLACGGYWATDDAQIRSICGVVKCLGNDASPRNGIDVWVDLNEYSAQLALCVSGIAAVANRNYGFLRRLLSLTMRTRPDWTEQSVSVVLTPSETLQHDYQKQLLPPRGNHSTPLNNHLFAALWTPLREYIPEQNSYDQAFDAFEYLFALAHCDASSDEGLKQGAGTADWEIWAPIGRFAWNRRRADDHTQKVMAFESGGPYRRWLTVSSRRGCSVRTSGCACRSWASTRFIAKVRPSIRAW